MKTVKIKKTARYYKGRTAAYNGETIYSSGRHAVSLVLMTGGSHDTHGGIPVELDLDEVEFQFPESERQIDDYTVEDHFVTLFLDKQPTDDELKEMELALNSRAPEWGEYELAHTGDDDNPAINMHNDSRPGKAPEKEAVEALKFLVEGLGYKVREVAGEIREE